MTIETYHQPATPALAPAAGYSLIRETAAAMADANAIAKAVCGTDMVPKHFRGKPDDLTAAILYGATLGFDPMQSARQVFVIHGQAALYARSMAALVLAAGHQVRTVATSDTEVTVEGRRRGSEHAETSTWTIDRAKKAGYTDNAKYRTDPQAMLYAKALSEVCRKIAPDVLNGVYAVEEMQLERVESERVDQPVGAVNSLRAALNPSPAPDVAASAESTPPDVSASSGSGPQQAGGPASAGEASGITSGQLKKIGAAMRERGITERTEALDFVNAVIGREVASRNDLTRDEAGAVIDALEDWSADTVAEIDAANEGDQ